MTTGIMGNCGKCGRVLNGSCIYVTGVPLCGLCFQQTNTNAAAPAGPFNMQPMQQMWPFNTQPVQPLSLVSKSELDAALARVRELEDENARLTKIVRGWTGADEADAAYGERIRQALIAAGMLSDASDSSPKKEEG